MATIDASIPLGVKPVQIESPMNQLAKVLQIQEMQQGQQMNRLKMDEYQRGIEDQNALRSALSAPGADPYKVLLQRGKTKEALDWRKGQADVEKTGAETKHKQIETAHKRVDLMGQTLGWVRQNPSPQNAMQAIQYLADNGVMPPEKAQEAIAKIQANPTPEGIAQFAEMGYRAALSAKDQLPTLQTNNIGGSTVTQGIDPVTGKASLVSQVQNTQSPDNAASNARAAADAAAGRSVTMRGQNMTDTRARDFNLVQQDANNVKREEKKSIADLTKNSQIASMDTMLGTLDRLSSHPGLSRSVGMTGAFPTMPGSQSANFQAELNTFQSQAFIPMVAQLKGMGALSDAEGKKLTAAVGALDPKMGEEAFRTSVTRIINDMEAARERLAGSRRTPKAEEPSVANPTAAKKITNDAEYNALPSGAVFVGPDGKQRRKP